MTYSQDDTGSKDNRKLMKQPSLVWMLGMLLCLSGMVQAMVIYRATVPALDAVRFVEMARAIDGQGLAATLRNLSGQPLFPVWTWLVHRAIACVAGEAPSVWVASVQVAAAIPLVLAVAPVYLASRRLYGARGALAGGLMFCVLPAVARLGAEGLSDSLHLFWFAVAFWGVVEFMTPLGRDADDAQRRGPAVGWLLLAGVATGVGVLSRVEIALAPIAWGLSMVILQLRPAWRQSLARLATAACGYVLGMAMVLGPYLVAVDSLGPHAAVARLLGIHEVAKQSVPAELAAERVTQAAGARSFSSEGMAGAFDVKEHSVRQFGYTAALRRYGEELALATNYWGLACLLVGFWSLRTATVRPLDRFGHVLFATFSLAAVQFAATVGYVSARHLMPLVVIGAGLAGLGALVVGEWVTNWLGRVSRFRISRPAASWSIVASGLLLCVVQGAAPLHAIRLADRQAGVWLAAHGDASELVLDTFGWTALYSGCPTAAYSEAKAAFADPRLGYVVVGREETQGASPRSRTLRYLLDQAGDVAAAFSSSQVGRSEVLVYRWHAERLDPRLIVRTGANELSQTIHGR